jgi:hypothetical protein
MRPADPSRYLRRQGKLFIDPLAIVLALVFLVGFFLIGSRFFPEDMRVHLWHFGARRVDRPSPEVPEDDDARFDWSQHKPGDGDDR